MGQGRERNLTTSEPITAVLLNWQRPDNIPPIIESILAQQPRVDEVIIWDNSGGNLTGTGEFGDKVRMVISPNRGVYGRYLAASMAYNDVIYFQDDDLIQHEQAKISEEFFANGGRLIANALDHGHMTSQSAMSRRLLGWGSFIRREWIECLQLWKTKYGEDRLLRSKADRIFVILARRQFHNIEAKFDWLPGYNGPEALYRRPDHAKMVSSAATLAQELIGDDQEII